MTCVDDLVQVVAAAESTTRARVALSADVLEKAAGLDYEERVRLKLELGSMGIKVREWWNLVQARVEGKKKTLRVVVGDGAPKPNIIVRGGDLAKLTTFAIRTLGEREEVFAREREFVTAMSAQGEKPPHIVTFSADTIRVLLADSASWAVWTEDGPRDIDPPANVVSGAVACPWKKEVRVLEQIIEAPTIRPDGSLVTEPGYDPDMRLLYEPNAEFPPIPEAPTRDDAMDALMALREVFENFPCETECDRMVLVAATITLVCRAAITGPVPAFAASANIKGSGKSKALGMACLIATGREGHGQGWPVEEAELEKSLDTAAIEGRPYIFFDNLEAPFAGPVLCSYLTSTVVRPRDFGRKRSILCPWRGVVFATGNNLRLGRDMDRRTVMCHLLSHDEKPHLRDEKQFKHHPLEDWVRKNRPRLVVAVLTLARAWILAGRPKGTQPTLGSFEGWSRFVPDCIEWANGVNPLERTIERGDENASEDDMAFGAVLSGLAVLTKGVEGLRARAIIDLLYPDGKAGQGDGYGELREALEGVVRKKNVKGVPESKALGEWLGARKNQQRGGIVLLCSKDRKDISLWSARPVTPKS